MTIDRVRLRILLERERTAFAERHPRSAAEYARAGHLFGRVPMTWMNKNAAGFPIYLAAARGATVPDWDGHVSTDFGRGDTAARAGHSPSAVVEKVQERFGVLGGACAMLPTPD